jgi:hypothetical protein
MIVTGIILMRRQDLSGVEVVSVILSTSIPVNDVGITSSSAYWGLGRPCLRKLPMQIGFIWGIVSHL